MLEDFWNQHNPDDQVQLEVEIGQGELNALAEQVYHKELELKGETHGAQVRNWGLRQKVVCSVLAFLLFVEGKYKTQK